MNFLKKGATRTYTKKIKELNKTTQVDLKKDIAKDLEEVPDKIINKVMIDAGETPLTTTLGTRNW